MTFATRRFPFAAVLFDLDGVVVDNSALHHAVWRAFASAHGVRATEEQIRATDGRRGLEAIDLLLSARVDPAELPALLDQREALYYRELGTANLKEIAGVRPYLANLKARGVWRVLATSGVPSNTDLVLSRLGLAELFEARLTAADVQCGKPDPEIYIKAAERVGTRARDCLVIEDALAGVQAAKAAGMRCLGITSTQTAASLLAQGADWVAPDFLHLPEEVQASFQTDSEPGRLTCPE